MKLFNWNKRRSNTIRGLVCAFLLCFVSIANAANALDPLSLNGLNDIQPAAIPGDLLGRLIGDEGLLGGSFDALAESSIKPVSPGVVMGASACAIAGMAFLGHYAYTYYYSDDRAAAMGEDLERALVDGDLTLVEALLNDENLYSLNANRRTPLCLAADHGHEAIVRYLIDDHGVDVNEWGFYREACLLSQKALRDPEIVALLLEAGADLYDRDTWGLMPLDVARMNGFQETADLLLAYGADELPWVVRLREAFQGYLLPHVGNDW